MDTIERPAPSTDLVSVDTLSPATVFAEGGVDAVLDRLRKEVRAVETDISTPAGRKAIASLAYKVARSKTALDEMGKNLVADWKVKAAAVDAERKRIRDDLDALRDEVRKPLDDWENADRLRIEAHETQLIAISDLAVFECEPTSEDAAERLLALAALPARDWQEFGTRATRLMAETLATLTKAHETALAHDAAVAEATRIKLEEEARIRRERDEAIAAAAAESARQEAEAKAAAEARAEAERVAAEQRRAAEETARQIQRIEQEKLEAAAKAERERQAAEAEHLAKAAEAERQRLVVERERKAAEDRAEAAHAAARRSEEARVAAAAKADADRIAAAQKAERDREAAIIAEQKRAADASAAEKAETARREQSRKHCDKINNEALTALIKVGLSEQAGTAAITAIARGEVAHVKISY